MDKNSSPKSYAERYVAFIDVLGFGALVSTTANKPKKAAKTIERVSSAIFTAKSELNETLSSKHGFQFTHFSDSFVISVEADREGGVTLSNFTRAISAVTETFLEEKLLLRGGITRGKLIHTADLLLGPAMNRAYELESKLAKVPRIILDPDVLELAHDLDTYYLAADEDGYWYLDYINPRLAWFLAPSYLFRLQKTINDIPKIPVLRAKRTWLVRKYNAVVTDFSQEAFSARLDDYVNDTDANSAVVEDYEMLLKPAKKLSVFAEDPPNKSLETDA